MKTKALSTLLLLAAGCQDEGVTYVAGPFPISMDASMQANMADGEVFPPCPTGYTCMDPAAGLAATGLQGSVSDQNGNPVRASCTNSQPESCEPANPAKSCPNLPNAFCAHVKISGALMLELDQCAQKCTP